MKPVSINFYKKNGFKKVGNTKFGDYAGIVMKKKSTRIQKGGWGAVSLIKRSFQDDKSSLLNSGMQNGGWGGNYP